MPRCSLHVLGCTKEGTKKVGEHWLCMTHYYRGLEIVARFSYVDSVAAAHGFQFSRSKGSPHSHGWKPYYRLDDAGPWQENAIKQMEDK